jgi:hypothetical protein
MLKYIKTALLVMSIVHLAYAGDPITISDCNGNATDCNNPEFKKSGSTVVKINNSSNVQLMGSQLNESQFSKKIIKRVD